MFQIIWLFWLLLFELVIVFGWIFSRLPHFIADESTGQRMLLWMRVLRVIEVHQDQTWQVTLQMNANHHPGRKCGWFSRLALYDWQLHCCCIYKQRKQQDVDVQESWTGCWWSTWVVGNWASPTWRMFISETAKVFQQIVRHVCWYVFMLLNVSDV